jgi:hypothetical protein
MMKTDMTCNDAVNMQENLGFRSCKGLSAPPRLRGGFAAKTFLRASVSPWWILCEVRR